jgi:structural maintenance of chromosomes protein 6
LNCPSDLLQNKRRRTNGSSRIPHDSRDNEDERTESRYYDATPNSDDEAGYEQTATQVVREKYREEAENAPMDCGILESVHVINFMCHENYMFDLGPLINFICGKNGSGKSAILTAITLCLGGKASSTNRGQSLKSFIKEGKENASISVRIRNRGDGAYLPADYGDTILVERNFSRSGTSGFKLKSQGNRVVSVKRGDLDEICDHFALQIDNPMNVLSQDSARQFIGSSSPADKYKFFVKGVQLEQLDQDYRIVEENLDNTESKLGQKQDDVKILKNRMEKAKQRLEMSDKHESIRDKLRNYRRQLAWSQVEELEQVRDEFEKEIREADGKIGHAEAEVVTLDQTYEAADQASSEATEAHQHAEEEVRKMEDEKKEAKAAQDEIMKGVRDAQADQRQLRDSLKNNEAVIRARQREIEEEKQRLAELDGGGAATRLAQLEEARENAAAAHRAFEELQSHRAGLEAKIPEAQQECREREQPLRAKRDEIEERQTAIESLSRNRNQQDGAFHPKMPALLRAIQNERSFTQRPVGPVGKHVRLLKPEWSSIMEKSFGQTLSSFIVTSKNDMNTLNRVMAQIKCICPIIIGNNYPLDTTPNEPDPIFDTVLRILAIDDDLVRKQLVIQHGIEQTILIADMEEASKVLYERDRPRNVRRCYSFDPNSRRRGLHLTYTRSGEASQDPIAEWKGPPRIRTDIEAQIRLRQEALQQAKQQLNQLENSLRAARDVLERAKQAVTRHRRREGELKLAYQQADDEVERLQDAINQDNVEGGKLEALRQAVTEAEEAKALDEGSFQDAVVALDEKKRQLSAAKAALTHFDQQIATLQSESKKVEVEAQKLSKKRATMLGAKNAAIARIDDARQDRASLQRKLEEMQTKLATFIEGATSVSARINVDEGETHQSLSLKYEKLTKDLARYDNQLRSTREQIALDAAQTEEAYRNGLKQMQDLEQLGQALKNALITRRDRWAKFRSFISARAKAQFTYLLSERSFRGKLFADHKQKLLDIQVEPDITKKDGSGRQAKTLSGGEKSFSQICLLLSIWEAMGSPIRCLDEFDVYMDSVNRKMSIDLLISAARQSKGRQFILITPGSKSEIKLDSDIHARE